MLVETEPDAAVFLGGMGGIADEYELFEELRPGRPRFPVGRPGGEARELLASEPASDLKERLLRDDVFPALWQSLLAELAP